MKEFNPMDPLSNQVIGLGEAYLSENGVIAVPSLLDGDTPVMVLAQEDPDSNDLIAYAVLIDDALVGRVIRDPAHPNAYAYQLEDNPRV